MHVTKWSDTCDIQNSPKTLWADRESWSEWDSRTHNHLHTCQHEHNTNTEHTDARTDIHIYVLYTLYIYIYHTLFILYLHIIETLTDDQYLVSLDLRSVHTNIPHIEGIEAVTKFFQKSKPFINISIIITFLRLILTLNSFIFNGVNYSIYKRKAVLWVLNAHLVMQLMYGLVWRTFYLPSDIKTLMTSF